MVNVERHHIGFWLVEGVGVVKDGDLVSTLDEIYDELEGVSNE